MTFLALRHTSIGMPNTPPPSARPRPFTRPEKFALRALLAAGISAERAEAAVLEVPEPEYVVAHVCSDGVEVLTRGLSHAEARRLDGELRAQGARSVCFEVDENGGAR